MKIPGQYQFIQGMRISDLILRAEGILDETYTGRAYLIRRNEDLSRQYEGINIGEILATPSASQNAVLRKYDIVQVFSKRRFVDPDSISVFGSVRN